MNKVPVLKSMKSCMFWLLCVGIFCPVTAQVYEFTNLSGANESPPNNSPGTGNATVTIDNNNMRVQASFSGLLGMVTVAHIHAATAVAGTGTAGVATQTPSFPGFPTGVTSGTYDMTFDMTSSSSYNASYITANGGTPAGAFAALKFALKEGRAYFNIHTTMYAGGEIRAFSPPPSYQNLSSMLTFNKISEAISSAMPGDTIDQINNAVETAPIELPLGYTFNFNSPYTLTVNPPSF